MSKYNLSELQRHWHETSEFFTQEFVIWQKVYSDLIVLVSDVASEFAGQRQLPQNCCYLLLSKALNHSLAAYSLIERGLVIDGALSARNALETLLMLELFVKDRTIDHFTAWANGQEYKPSYVRNKLKQLPKATVGDFIIEVDRQHYEDLHFGYSWLSRITHANLESFRHTTSQDFIQLVSSFYWRKFTRAACYGKRSFCSNLSHLFRYHYSLLCRILSTIL